MADKYFRIFGYPALYVFYGVVGYIFVYYSDIPGDYDIFHNYRDALINVLEYEMNIPLSYHDRQGDRDV